MSTPRRPLTIWLVVALLLFLALGALPAAWRMLANPNGDPLGIPQAWIDATPFGSFLIPGIFLLGMGIFSLLAVVALLLRPSWTWATRLNPLRAYRWEWTLALGMGLYTMAWIAVQYLTMQRYFWLQPVIFGVGLAIVLLMVEPHMRRYYAAPPR